ncbi:MAG: 23S rRNA pseudouridine synthase [Pelagibacterales bacterium]|nr:23S rRNA pseudouridine synthase [Pelagibacterales bacterium]
MKIYKITDDDNKSRLDRWIRRNICEIPQSLIEKNIRKGNIKVNNKKEKSSYKLKKNDSILIHNINFAANKHKKKTEVYTATKKDLSQSKNLIVENNENFVVVNKPAGIAVQSGTKSRKNILDILKSKSEFEGFTPYSVHRIDKDTTGILIVAKNRKYAQLFTSLFRLRKIHKTYLGITVGVLKNSKGTIKDDLIYTENNKSITVAAITNYLVLNSNNNYSFLKLNPITGRKHQLRKQLLMHGCPILGDSKYRFSETKKIKKNNLMLHAYRINFSINKKKFSYQIDPPNEFVNMLKEKYLKTF